MGIDENTGQPLINPLETPITRRDLLKGAAAVGASFALAPLISACGGAGTSASPSAAGSLSPKAGGALRLGVTGGSTRDVIDVPLAYNLPDLQRVTQLYDRLVMPDHQFKMQNALAEEIVATSPDATVWTIRVKPDVVFHNGKPLTADDVIYTFRRILNPKFVNSASTLLADVDPKRLKKVDSRTVEVHLKRANAVLRDTLSEYHLGIVPVGFDPKNPVGTGAFQFQSFTPGERSVFVANKNYWGEGPHVDSVTTINFVDNVAMVNALLGNSIDAAAQVPSAQLPTIESHGGLGSIQNKTGNATVMFTRCDLKPFSDVRVRQALRLIMDRPQAINVALDGYGRAASDMLCPFDPAYPTDLPQRAQDLAQAKSLLKQAGQENLAFTLLAAQVGAGALEVCQVFAEQAKGAGVTVNVKKMDMGIYYGPKYTTWPAGVDWWSTRNYLTWTRLNSVWNDTHFSDPNYSSLVQQAFTTVDDAKRNALVRQCYEIDHDMGGYIVWAFTNSLDAFSTKVAGFASDATTSFNGGQVNQVWFA